MNLIWTVIFVLFAAFLLWYGLSIKKGNQKLTVSADVPADDRHYWEQINKKFYKSSFIGAVGSLLTAIALYFRLPLPAEVGCITLMASFVFELAFICRKTSFRPCEQSAVLQKKIKLFLLLMSFISLFLTQAVFDCFV